ncbi:MAG: Gfo/Idh/MocA family oxidoreductase [Spirulinaceae cyanobacterium RM2_2_10]|nr:Gfo/Idh/MocA family oxidoreductase [Spirulinaceae cyanobacterium RM2_2_10]
MSTSPQTFRVGIVGTGYAGQRRAEAIAADPRAELVAIAGHTPAKVAALCETHQARACDSWRQLVGDPQLDLVIVANVNRAHAEIVRAVLEAGKHVIVEYPLALDPAAARSLLELARRHQRLLHIEHIELLGGMHQSVRQALPRLGAVNYARYVTLTPQRPVAGRWTYDQKLFGFPLVAALSRVHRLTDLLGAVVAVSGQARYWDLSASGAYHACLCAAQLRFASGAIAEITYGKGEVFWQAARTFELHGEAGTLIFEGESGRFIRGEQVEALTTSRRRGLFAQDTDAVLSHLTSGQPLYVEPTASLYALEVADAVRQSVATGQMIALSA